jgi:hypothetical protein
MKRPGKYKVQVMLDGAEACGCCEVTISPAAADWKASPIEWCSEKLFLGDECALKIQMIDAFGNPTVVAPENLVLSVNGERRTFSQDGTTLRASVTLSGLKSTAAVTVEGEKSKRILMQRELVVSGVVKWEDSHWKRWWERNGLGGHTMNLDFGSLVSRHESGDFTGCLRRSGVAWGDTRKAVTAMDLLLHCGHVWGTSST